MRKLLIALLLMILCLSMAAGAEPLTFADEALRLHITLPEGWVQADTDNAVFAAPDESGIIYVAPTDYPVTKEMVEGFSAEVIQAWVEDWGGGTLTDLQMLLFAKATDDDGNLYLIASCGVMAAGVPNIYTVYAYTAADGTLSMVIGISANNDAGAVCRECFDQMIVDNIPADVLQKLMDAIGS